MGFGLMGAVLSLAMLILVLWQSHSHRDNQIMAVYLFSVFIWSLSVFSSRLCRLIGVNPQYFLFTTVLFLGLTSVLLFTVVCQQAGWMSKAWVRALIALGLALRFATVPLMLGGYMFRDVRISETGTLGYSLSPLETAHTLVTNIYCVLALAVIVRHRNSGLRGLFWGTLTVALGFASSITPWRNYSLSIILAAISTLFFTAAILKKHLFNPLMAANRQLATAKEAAEEASLEKSRFLTKMSHELRTPLNAIIGYTELLMEEAQEDNGGPLSKTLPDLSKIGIASKHLLALINDILDLSRIEAHKLEIRAERIQLKSFLSSIEATILPLAGRGNNVLQIENLCPEEYIYSDPVRLRQVLINLLGNATKFTSNGKLSLSVTIEVKSQNSPAGRRWLVFKVSDTGIGIPPDRLEHIFEAFYQIQIEGGHTVSGTGLGLTISRQLSRLLGGDLSAESELGKGSVFTVRLPIQEELTGA